MDKAIKGEVVELKVDIAEGFILDSEGNEIEVIDNKFIMPDDNVTIKAIVSEKENPVVEDISVPQNPQTEDNVTLYIISLIISLSGFTVVNMYSKNKKQKIINRIIIYL